MRYISVVLYLRLPGQFQDCLFFLRKDFERKKAPKRKTKDFHPLRTLCASKTLLPLLLSVRLFLFC